MDHLLRLFAHVAWADERALESLRESHSPVPGALSLYSHVLGTEHIWLTRIVGGKASMVVWPTLSVEECARVGRENMDAFRKVIVDATREQLEQGITYRNTAGNEFTSTLEDILLHVALHGSYHRGQVALMLRSAGETPATTDYIAFVRGAPAATRPQG